MGSRREKSPSLINRFMTIPKPSRSCGGCQACCIAPALPELAKPVHTPCFHLGSRGCDIYSDPSRPRVCGAYRCLWLDGAMGDDERPDKLGVIFEVRAEPKVVGGRLVIVRELWRGALNQERVKILVRRITRAAIWYERYDGSRSVSGADSSSL